MIIKYVSYDFTSFHSCLSIQNYNNVSIILYVISSYLLLFQLRWDPEIWPSVPYSATTTR